MNMTFEHAKHTIELDTYKQALENFLQTNGSDLPPVLKEKIREQPDNYVLFGNSEDGLEVSLKDPDLHT